MKTAIITGINGQDGSYLAEYLLSLDYEVYGIIRRQSVAENQTNRIQHIIDKFSNYWMWLCYAGSLYGVSK